jgi:hypothetical protein
MNREEYLAEADRLLKSFARSYDSAGPQHGHKTQEARDRSRAITEHAVRIDPGWFPPIKPSA